MYDYQLSKTLTSFSGATMGGVTAIGMHEAA